MNAERWAAMQAAFDELVECDTGERASRLAQLAARDPELHRGVRALLVADAEPSAELAALQGALRTASAAASDPLGIVGRTISHFEVHEPLGIGGMGVVYRARDVRLDRTVALKFPLPSYSLDATARARFLREAHSAATLDHPNLCSIYEVGGGAAGDRLFLAMPFYEGETLKGRLAADPPIPIGQVLAIARQVASGLEAAHAAGIVHRDLKPGNIMLLPDGSLKILDFGLAKPRDHSLSAAGARMGTVGYMAPEQIRGLPLDGRADLWALGVMLFEMIARRKPFTGADDIAVAHRVLHDKPVFPLAPPDDLSAELQDVVLKLLRKPPDKRYASATQLRADLARVEQLATLSGSRRRWRRLTRAVRTQPGRATAAAGLLLAAAAGLAYATTARRVENPLARLPRSEIAVLPFRNLSAPGSWVYFGSALHDEILTQLYRVPGISVRGRTSLLLYVGASKPPRQVAMELGARTVVSGSVGEGPRGLRVQVEAIDAATGSVEWTATYDRPVSEAFAIQSSIVLGIVQAAGVELSDGDRGRLTRAPPVSGDVYREYLAGREYVTDGPISWPKLDLAQLFLDRAIGYDSTFALALAARSGLYAWRQLLVAPPFPEHGPLQRRDAEAAVRFAAELPQAHYAMGVAHLVGDRRDAAAALAEFTIAQQGLPNDADVAAEMAESQRALGHWSEAARQFQRATALDPRNRALLVSAGRTYVYTREYARALAAFDSAAALANGDAVARSAIALDRGRTYLLWRGNIDTLRVAAERAAHDSGSGMASLPDYARVLLWTRDGTSLLAALRGVRTPLLQGAGVSWPSALFAGWAHQLRGEPAAARASFDSALSIVNARLRGGAPGGRERDAAGALHAARGLALAELGRREEARRDAAWLLEAAPMRHDASIEPLLREARARIHARTGDADRAIDDISWLLANPAPFSVHNLRLDPLWDPIRHHPRFVAMLTR